LSIDSVNNVKSPKTRKKIKSGRNEKGSSKKITKGREISREKQGSLQFWTRSKTKPLETVTFYACIIRDGS